MISWDKYFKRLTSVSVEYDLARRSILSFKGDQAILTKLANDRFEDFKKSVIENCRFLGTDPNQTWISDDEKVTSWIGSYIETIPQTLSEIENRFNQNELIMKVTLFEIILKDAHREILKQNPSLLSPNKKIPLGKLIKQGKDELIKEEIERDVNALDRKNIREKAEHFKKHLSVDWSFDGHILPIVEHVLDLRNKIVHEQPDIQVDESSCFDAMVIAMTIPLNMIAQCAVLYPDGFEPLGDDSNLMEYFRNKLQKGK